MSPLTHTQPTKVRIRAITFLFVICSLFDGCKIAQIKKDDAQNSGADKTPDVAQADPQKIPFFYDQEQKKDHCRHQASQLGDLGGITAGISQTAHKKSHAPPERSGDYDVKRRQSVRRIFLLHVSFLPGPQVRFLILRSFAEQSSRQSSSLS